MKILIMCTIFWVYDGNNSLSSFLVSTHMSPLLLRRKSAVVFVFEFGALFCGSSNLRPFPTPTLSLKNQAHRRNLGTAF